MECLEKILKAAAAALGTQSGNHLSMEEGSSLPVDTTFKKKNASSQAQQDRSYITSPQNHYSNG